MRLTEHSGYCSDRRQYFSFWFEQSLVERQSELCTRIVQFFNERVAGRLPHENFVIDFALLPESDQLKVIELNPFHVGAGAGLFKWSEDRELFMVRITCYGRVYEEETCWRTIIRTLNVHQLFPINKTQNGPLEMRVVQSPEYIPNPTNCIPRSWLKHLPRLKKAIEQSESQCVTVCSAEYSSLGAILSSVWTWMKNSSVSPMTT